MTFYAIAAMAGLLCCAMAIAWAAQRLSGNSGWVDTIWSLATGLAVFLGISLAEGGDETRKWVAAGLIGLWSLRLASHIGHRSSSGKEDPRYAALLEEWGDKASSRLFRFLQIQALASLVLGIAVMAVCLNPQPFGGPLDLLGIAIGVVALAGEALSDWQLSRFRKKHAGEGRICDVGLWSLSRHPNYFCEWLFWCAWPFLAFAGIEPTGAQSFLSLLAPVMMYWLLNHVSGIPFLEEHMLRSRGDAFRRYQQRVNAFFPGLPLH